MITRSELYEMIWKGSGKAVAAQLGVSDSYLSRVCRALDVPRPPPGWQAKQKAGRAPPPPPLPRTRLGDPEIWSKGDASGLPIRYLYRFRDRAAGEHVLVTHARQTFANARESGDKSHLISRSSKVMDLTVSGTTLAPALQFSNTLLLALERSGHAVKVAPRQGFIVSVR